ncbi:TonB-dependent receptor [Aquimarina pacifica]|uniref:TonB-dependent receptor n=1 Tax=Aquimarina pacifica TaxID=1296415 RepID=UPI00046FB6FA|nr:TonB-dependent receptor [Aquimarina pacifica]
MKKSILLFLLFASAIASAQVVINGKVLDDYDEPIPGVNITLKGTSVSTISNFDGQFTINVPGYPFTLTAKSIGYDATEVLFSSETEDITVTMSEITFLAELVISASRTPERVFESPVSIEYYSASDIKNTTAPDFFSGLENIKGVDVNTNSLTYKSVNTRGYGSFSNARFVQMVDGMDQATPSSNFSIGNLIGLSELDVNNIELLPGASSALYGANAFNGILFMTSKNPFDYQGISGYGKTGITSQEAAGENAYYDLGVRLAHAFSDKFAVKANISYLKGTDWHATNYANNGDDPSLTRSSPTYNGINIYGDENLQQDPATGISATRTGYKEEDLVEYNAENLKLDVSLHYRPMADDLEIIYNGKMGQGTTLLQNANRFYAPNFFAQQHKLEVRNNRFFVRGYVTAENSNDSYDTRITAVKINQAWKSDEDWISDYANQFLLTGDHDLARAAADSGRFLPDTPEFRATFNEVIQGDDDPTTADATFKNETQLRHVDANYNFRELTGALGELQIGGSYRQYRLRSFGTLYSDTDESINYGEMGAYAQLQKRMLEDRLKITASFRYDKSELFDGNISPRFSVGYSMGEDRNHNIRASVQSGFRNPTTQNVYMNLDVQVATTVGTAEDNLDRGGREYAISDFAQGTFGAESTKTITPREAIANSYTLDSAFEYFGSIDFTTFQGDVSLLEQSDIALVKPEKVTAFEVGYRGQLGDLTVDLSGYYNQYQDFITSRNVVVPLFGQVSDLSAVPTFLTGDFEIYNIATNSNEDVNSYGLILGLSSKVFGNYDFGVNYTFAKEDVDVVEGSDFISEFNTPEHKVKATFGNKNLFDNFGFNTSLKWSDTFVWNDAFGTSQISAYTVFDAQINYRISSLKSLLKIGATNIGGEEYFGALGTGGIGSQYYIGLTINNL